MYIVHTNTQIMHRKKLTEKITLPFFDDYAKTENMKQEYTKNQKKVHCFSFWLNFTSVNQAFAQR